MTTSEKWGLAIGIILVLLIAILIVSMLIPTTRAAINAWKNELHKVDDATTYKTRKQVEETCRATIVSYNTDKMMWEQYKDHEGEEQHAWADAAKLRANKAAVTYNEYFLKNSYVFNGNIPADIRTKLDLIE